jgi:hypothetical protein
MACGLALLVLAPLTMGSSAASLPSVVPNAPPWPATCPLDLVIPKVWPWQPGGCLVDAYRHANGTISRADGEIQSDFPREVRAGEAVHFTATFHVPVCTASQLQKGPGDCEEWRFGSPVNRYLGVVDEATRYMTAQVAGNWKSGWSVVPSRAGSWVLLSITDYLLLSPGARVQPVIVKQFLAWVVPRRLQVLVVNSTRNDINDAEARKGECNVTPEAARPTCTLSQAILVSNGLHGRTIEFDIPHGHGNTFDGGLPEIESGTPTYSGEGRVLPDATYHSITGIDAQTTIDGSSQPGAGKVEIVGPYPARLRAVSPDSSDLYGLQVDPGADGTVIRDMVIHGFMRQIEIEGAGGVTVEDCDLGTTSTGREVPMPGPDYPHAYLGVDGVYISHGRREMIGSPGNGNIITGKSGVVPVDQQLLAQFHPSDFEGAGVVDTGTSVDDVVEANTFPAIGYAYQSLVLDGRSDQIGGPDAGAGNTINDGPSSVGPAAVVQGNTFEAASLSTDSRTTIGGPSTKAGTAPGNVFCGNEGCEPCPASSETRPLEVGDATSPTALVPGNDSVVQGNLFRGECYGIGLSVETDGITVGGGSAGAGNVFEDFTSPRQGPLHFAPLAVGGLSTGWGGEDQPIVVRLDLNDPPTDVTVTGNTFSGNEGNAAVDVYQGTGISIYANVMTGNTQGIVLGDHGYVRDGDAPQGVPGPNDYLEYPHIIKAVESGGRTEVTVSLFTERAELKGAYSIDLYGQSACIDPGREPGQGEVYIGRMTLPTGALGSGDATLSYPATRARALTATAVDAKGDTSEFSACSDLAGAARP